MICCVDCFLDQEIIDIIESYKHSGVCEVCGNSDSYICDTNLLSDYFEELLNIYTPVSSLDTPVPPEFQIMLKEALYRNWKIFNLEPDKIQILISNICQEKYQDTPELFESPVTIPEANDEKYLTDHSILNNISWEDFVNEIKYENRFHLSNNINLDILGSFFEYFVVDYPKGKEFFRARLNKNRHAYPAEKMSAPPKEKSSAGRANPKGITVLYLSNDIDTTISESRARKFDYLTIGTFELRNDIRVISFKTLDNVSPFLLNDITEYAINKSNLTKISSEIAKPLRRHDSELDYLPTQYLTEYIKAKGYDGIEYNSTINPSGFNLVVFDESNFACSQTKVYEINELQYDHVELIK